jgi:hypothetical protein
MYKPEWTDYFDKELFYGTLNKLRASPTARRKWTSAVRIGLKMTEAKKTHPNGPTHFNRAIHGMQTRPKFGRGMRRRGHCEASTRCLP